MGPQVCVSCLNQKNVNTTSNRLVTENCGHVKCLDCLVKEQDGCLMCLREQVEERPKEIFSGDFEVVKEVEFFTKEGDIIPLCSEYDHPYQECPFDEQASLEETPEQPYTIDIYDLSVNPEPDLSSTPLTTVTETTETESIGTEVSEYTPSSYEDLSESTADDASMISEHTADDASMISEHIERATLPSGTAALPQESSGVVPVVRKRKADTSHIETNYDDKDGKSFYCTICKKRFYARSQIMSHAYCNGQKKPFQCEECDKSFATMSHYKYHMRVHRGEKGFKCDECGDSFYQSSKLKRHRLTKHTNVRKYACGDCDKSFSEPTALKRHALMHSEERPYACAVCGRQFRDASNYRRHVLKHDKRTVATETSSSASHDCGACGRMMPSREALAAHVRLEHEQRSFRCPWCPQAFALRKDMRRHSAVHTDSKPFRCKVCKRKFRRKDNLERHIRNTHPEFKASENIIECDQSALTDILTNTIITAPPVINRLLNTDSEKAMLQIMNPLPPLSDEDIQKHMNMRSEPTEIVKVAIDLNIASPKPIEQVIKTTGNAEPPEELLSYKPNEIEQIDAKSYILEANNARQSVIFGPVAKKDDETKKVVEPEQEFEYVHKIRKANMMASKKQLPLPPIDENKIMELEKKSSQSFEVGMPSKNMEVYKKILYEKGKEGGQSKKPPAMHWRRRMQLNVL